MELENSIRRDPVEMAAPSGGLHPITRYVMNYLRVACQSRQTLEQVFEDYGHPLKEYPKLDDRVPSSSSLSVQMDWIMELLENNLEAKSNIYKDPALCYVFLMNNGRYIVQKTKDNELGTLLGDDWIRKHTAKVLQFHVHYQRSSWNKVLRILKLDRNGSVPPNGLANSMKEKLKSFNTAFEEICREQSSWFVFDEQVREEIRISLEKILLPAYVNFVGRFQSVPELGKHADKYIKYGTEDIQARLNDLFQGSSGSTGSRRLVPLFISFLFGIHFSNASTHSSILYPKFLPQQDTTHPFLQPPPRTAPLHRPPPPSSPSMVIDTISGTAVTTSNSASNMTISPRNPPSSSNSFSPTTTEFAKCTTASFASPSQILPFQSQSCLVPSSLYSLLDNFLQEQRNWV
ncbi:Exocyst complex component EXO70B1 [Spatholobus suberectus]|nr:Exocyst complex component EXO70B1 [Spatholobus suberectus]